MQIWKRDLRDILLRRMITHLASLTSSELLGPGGRSPLVLNARLLESLLDGTRAGTAGELGEGVRGEDEVAVGELLAGDASSGAVNEGAVVVDDLGNDGKLAGRGTVVDEDDTADLDKALESGRLLLRLGLLAFLRFANTTEGGLVVAGHGSARSLGSKRSSRS